jgi:large subunit ribosomal protein L4
MKVDLYNIKAEKIGQITLPSSHFSAKVKPSILSQYVRVHLSNRRRASAKVKDRGEVAGTTKKMWAQKGTGRARHSTAKAPLFVGGGSAHGPTGKQNYHLKISQSARRLALKAVLSQFAKDKRIIAVDRFSSLPPKTKSAWNLVDGLEKDNKLLAESKRVAFVTTKKIDNLKRALANIPGIDVLTLTSLNAFDLSCQNFLIFSQAAVKKIVKL